MVVGQDLLPIVYIGACKMVLLMCFMYTLAFALTAYLALRICLSQSQVAKVASYFRSMV